MNYVRVPISRIKEGEVYFHSRTYIKEEDILSLLRQDLIEVKVLQIRFPVFEVEIVNTGNTMILRFVDSCFFEKEKEVAKEREIKKGDRFWYIDETLNVNNRVCWDTNAMHFQKMLKIGNVFESRERVEEKILEVKKILEIF